ncbi:transposase [Methylobacterium sp. AMS5]|nr:transposase [Methylobacterium sp. AMS5]
MKEDADAFTGVRRSPLAPRPSGGDHVSHRIEAQADLILTTYEARPAIFRHELRDALVKHGVQTSTSSLSRFFARRGITRKTYGPPRPQVARIRWSVQSA